MIALALAVGGSSASARQAGWNLTGTWVGQDSGIFVVKQSGNTIAWYGHAADNKTWAHDFKGTLQGDYIVGHFQDRPGFTYHYQGALALHILDNNHFVWVASHGGVTSFPMLTRSWTRVSAPKGGTVDLCAPSDCSGLNITLDPALDPGETTINANVGCGTRATSSARGLSSCLIEGVMSATSDLTSPLDPATAKALRDALKSVELLPSLDTGQHDLIAGLVDTLSGVSGVTRAVEPLTAPQLKGLDIIVPELETDPAAGPFSSDVDKATAPAVPPDQGRVTAGIVVVTALAPRPSSVIRSIQTSHPSAADVKAYAAAITLGTSATYSPARAVARLELLLAEAGGRAQLAHELAGKPPVVIAKARATVALKARRALALKASLLGARALRLLGIKGLAHRATTVRLQVTVARGGTRHSLTKLLRVR